MALYFTSWAAIQWIFFSQLKQFKSLPFVTISAVVGEGYAKSFLPFFVEQISSVLIFIFQKGRSGFVREL